MQRTLVLAASPLPSALSLRHFMPQLHCRELHNLTDNRWSNALVGANYIYRNLTQFKFRRVGLDYSKLGSGNFAPSEIKVSSGSSHNCFGLFSANNLLFSKRCFSQVPRIVNKDDIVDEDGDGSTAKDRIAVKGFHRKRKKPKVLASQIKDKATSLACSASKGAAMASLSEPNIGTDCMKGEVERSTTHLPSNNSEQAFTAGSGLKQHQISKKTKEQHAFIVASGSEAASMANCSKSNSNSKTKGSEKNTTKKATKEEFDSTSLNPAKRNGNSGGKGKLSEAANMLPHKQNSQDMGKVKAQANNRLKPLYPPRGKSVVVVESTTKAKVIQGYLGNMYEVLPSYGHVRNLAGRSGSVRPDDDFSIVWEVPSAAWTHLKSIKAALNGAENLILASDPDREGEVVAWHIIEMLRQQDALHRNTTLARVTFHEITESAIKIALQTPKEIDTNLVNAYLARRALEYLISFNMSPLLWRKLPGCQSAGRVQSAALSLICDREMEIDMFKPQEYWNVEIRLYTKGNCVAFPARLTHLNAEKLKQLSISTLTEAEDIKQRISLENFQVIAVKRSTMRKNPPIPYITSTLLQDASNKLKFSATYTMKLAQKLYEGVQISKGETSGLITYMRADGLHISDEAVKDICSLVSERYGKSFTSESPRKYFKKVKNAQEAHEAIRPTDIQRLPSMLVGVLEEDSLKLYTLIWSRSVACQMEPAAIAEIQLDIGNASESITFRSSSSKVQFPGYLAAYEDVETKAIKNKDEEGNDSLDAFEILNSLKLGDPLRIGEVELNQHQTQPPPRYSEGSLVKKLEELGIGRASTFASILKILQERNFVYIKNQTFYPEFRGRMMSAFLTSYFSEISDYSITADMETELDNVSAGLTEWKGLLRDYWTRFSLCINRANNVHIHQVEKMLEKKYGELLFGSLPDQSRTCPSCAEGILMFKVSKFDAGYFIGCNQHPRCKYIAKTYYREEEEEDAYRNDTVVEPKLLGVHPVSNEKVLVKTGPYGTYVQLGEDRTGYLPKRAAVSHIKDVEAITLEDAFDLLRYPLTLGNHPTDGKPVILKLGRFGFTLRHRSTMASVPKKMKPNEVTLEKALKLLSGKDVRRSGRPVKVKPKVEEETAAGEKSC